MIDSLNDPFQLPCGSHVKNRIVKAALTERLAGPDHLPNQQHFRLYEHWAKNGASVLLSGNILVDKRYLESNGNVVIEADTPKQPFKDWTAIIARENCHFWAQLSHAGRQSSRFATRHPVSASDIQLKKMALFAKPIPLTESGIEEVIQRFVFAAKFCKECGFSGIQLHAAHGYLISQFLSPRTNVRTDKWGGSLDNRARLLYTIIEQTRKTLGASYPISVKLNSADFQRGGFDDADATEVIKALESRGVDVIEISGGTYEQSAMFGIGVKESTKAREAYFLDFARTIRKSASIPIMVTGGFRSLKVSEEAIKEGALDLVVYGRPFLMHEDFPKGFLTGTLKQVSEPIIKILDPANTDAAEAGYYDLQIRRLANGLPLRRDYNALRLALHLPVNEIKMGVRNWMYRR